MGVLLIKSDTPTVSNSPANTDRQIMRYTPVSRQCSELDPTAEFLLKSVDFAECESPWNGKDADATCADDPQSFTTSFKIHCPPGGFVSVASAVGPLRSHPCAVTISGHMQGRRVQDTMELPWNWSSRKCFQLEFRWIVSKQGVEYTGFAKVDTPSCCRIDASRDPTDAEGENNSTVHCDHPADRSHPVGLNQSAAGGDRWVRGPDDDESSTVKSCYTMLSQRVRLVRENGRPVAYDCSLDPEQIGLNSKQLFDRYRRSDVSANFFFELGNTYIVRYEFPVEGGLSLGWYLGRNDLFPRFRAMSF